MFVALGVALHIACLMSIFDMYFRSPIVHGMVRQKMPPDPPAKRLVLIVGDGMRAHSFFEMDDSGKSRAPFLRSVMEKSGSWGISHTHVPTESRPGHVAIIAGFYEDVSAVTRGWKENPVEFDSVFNQSRHTWSWGSPDILPMFEKGATKNRVSAFMYPAEVEDFGDEDASHLDHWVFERVKAFLNTSTMSKEDASLIHEPGLVFFLHLLGTDTNGHAHRPSSWQYKQNIALVDEGVRNLTEQIDEFFHHDGRTAYVFTSDHGMTDWGVHGSGLLHETLTPLVVWGAGAAGPTPRSPKVISQAESSWNVGDLEQRDVEQADIAPLMSALLGIPIPVNNVGKLPVNYLGTDDEYSAQSKLSNAKQILSQFDIMASLKQANTPELLFVPFPELLASRRADMLRGIDRFLHQKKWPAAIQEMERLIDITLRGLRYYQTYDRVFIGGAVALGIVGAMLCIITEVVRTSYSHMLVQAVPVSLKVVFVCIFACMATVLVMQGSPAQYYLYGSLPLGCAMFLSQRFSVWPAVFSEFTSIRLVGQQLSYLFFLLLALEILVGSFFWRWSLSVGLFCLSVWPWYSGYGKRHLSLSLTWSLGCCVLAIFPAMPVVGGEPQVMVVNAAGCLLVILYPLVMSVVHKWSATERKEIVVSFLQYCFLLVALYVVNATAVRRKAGVSVLLQQTLSWCLLFFSPLLPIIGTRKVAVRLVRVAMSISTVYLLMAVSYEALFLIALATVVCSWLCLEALDRHDDATCFTYFKSSTIDESISPIVRTQLDNGAGQFSASLSMHGAGKEIPKHTVAISWLEVRSAYLLLFFSTVAFFGTGNIASLNSFSLSSVTTFMTVFSPYIMSSLLVAKVVMPLLIVGCVFNAVRDVCAAPVREFFALAVVMGDFLALHFFFLVRDSGSWLDIGTSISHYAIATIMAAALLLVCALAYEFMAVHAFIGEDKSHED